MQFFCEQFADDNFLQLPWERVGSLLYNPIDAVPRRNQQTIAEKKVDNPRVRRRAASRHGFDLHAVSIARRTPE